MLNQFLLLFYYKSDIPIILYPCRTATGWESYCAPFSWYPCWSWPTFSCACTRKSW